MLKSKKLQMSLSFGCGGKIIQHLYRLKQKLEQLEQIISFDIPYFPDASIRKLIDDFQKKYKLYYAMKVENFCLLCALFRNY